MREIDRAFIDDYRSKCREMAQTEHLIKEKATVIMKEAMALYHEVCPEERSEYAIEPSVCEVSGAGVHFQTAYYDGGDYDYTMLPMWMVYDPDWKEKFQRKLDNDEYPFR